MQTENRFFDDLARLFAGAAGNIASLRQELETRMREQVERLLRGMDLVSREEFDAVQAMAAKARAEQLELERRLAALEARLGGAPAAAAATPDTAPPDAGMVPPADCGPTP
jgi:BMFP domain-containing protein YqiC